jgi:hypothetical protein
MAAACIVVSYRSSIVQVEYVIRILCSFNSVHPVTKMAPDTSITIYINYIALEFPGIFLGNWGGGGFNKFRFWHRKRGSGGGSPLVRGSTRFANEWNPYSGYVVMDAFSTELGIRLSFGKTSEFRGVPPNPPHPNPPRYATATLHRAFVCNIQGYSKWLSGF